MKLALLGLALLAAAIGSPAGRYRLADGPETASELLLHPDGRYEYFLSEGALDEVSSGRWTSEAGEIRLTTMPKPKPATFAPGPVSRDPAVPLTIRVVSPDGRGLALVDFRIAFSDGSSDEGYTQETGWSAEPGERRIPRALQLAVPMYKLVSPAFLLDPRRGNVFTFVLTPNDLGHVDLTGVRLLASGPDLVMERNGARLLYRREATAKDGQTP